MQDLGTLGGASSSALAHQQQRAGRGVGRREPAGSFQDAFLYSNGTMTALDNSGDSGATAINNEGQIVVNVGDSVFLYSNGTKTNITGTAAEGSQRHQRRRPGGGGYTFAPTDAFLWSARRE